MAEQGIASGGPYDNAASYPRIVAIFMGICLVAQYLMPGANNAPSEIPEHASKESIGRAMALLGIFLTYLIATDYLGYQIATPVMIFSIMVLCGEKKLLRNIVFAIVSSLVVAFVFEKLLKVVLPGGIFQIHIPW